MLGIIRGPNVQKMGQGSYSIEKLSNVFKDKDTTKYNKYLYSSKYNNKRNADGGLNAFREQYINTAESGKQYNAYLLDRVVQYESDGKIFKV